MVSRVDEFESLGRLCFGGGVLRGGGAPSGPCAIGVDEAGRGPTLGPMVYGVAFCPLADVELLERLGCADSKSLTEDKREHIFRRMIEESEATASIGWIVDVISPTHISNCMLRRAKYSLNEVSMNSAINLIKKAEEAGIDIAEVYVDTVGPPEKYQAKLEAIFPKYKITVAKKADSTYPIVSAASIAAKVTRDHALKHWKFVEDVNLTQEAFGSGYPGDPVTKKFIKEQIDPVFGYPQLVRFSWSTADLALKDNALNFEWEDEEDEQPKKKKKLTAPSGTPNINRFFCNTKENNVNQKKKRHRFFSERMLVITDNF